MKKSRKFTFGILLWLVFFLLLEAGLAGLGVEPRIKTEDPYVGFAEHIPLFVEDEDDRGRVFWKTADNKRRFFNPQAFAAEKPANEQRIFCLGGSTTYGRPYSDTTSFCGWLREFLPAASPGSAWEIVNAGGISYASYRVAAVARELAGREPDYFVIYTGHNEFLEERTYADLRDRSPALRRLDSLLRSTRIDAALHGLLDVDSPKEQPVLPGEVSALLDGSIGPAAYERDDALRSRVLTHYRYNLEQIIRIAREAGAQPLLVVPASNLRSCSPFRSTHAETLSAEGRVRWQQWMAQGQSALEEGDPEGARRAFGEAVATDPRQAEGHYQMGQALLALSEPSEAERSLRRARDEDICPLRALSPMASIVREVAEAENVPSVDFETLLADRVRAQAGHGAAGDDWFLDHVHPTIEGHRLLALEIIRTMTDAAWIETATDWNADQQAAIGERVLGGLDRRAHGVALRNLAKVLSWAGKSADAARIAQKATDYLDEDANLDFILGTHAAEAGNLEEALSHYQRALARDPLYLKARNNLGTTLAGLGRDPEAVAAYRAVIEEDPQHFGARFNLANALLRIGEVDEAARRYEEVLQNDPTDGDARFNLGRAHLRGRRWGAAAEAFRKVIESDPSDWEAREALDIALDTQRTRE